MQKITLHVGNRANSKTLLTDLKLHEKEALEINIEQPSRQPVISRAPLGLQEAKEAFEYIYLLLHADSIVRLTVEGIITNIAWECFKRTITPFRKFFAANNKQKGNAWGAKIEIRSLTKTNQEQVFSFFLDNIPEEKLFEAIEKIEHKIKDITNSFGEIYMNELKNIGFQYEVVEDRWQIIGVEKMDGKVDAPK